MKNPWKRLEMLKDEFEYQSVPMQKGYVKVDGLQMHYRIGGEGETVLLIHQASMSSDEYLSLLPLMANKYQTIAIDLPGHGNSDDPIREYEIEDFANVVLGFADAMDLTSFNVVAHHTGALIAVDLSVSYPGRVSKLILSGCPMWGDEEWQLYLNQPRVRDIPITNDGEFLMRSWERYQEMSNVADPSKWFIPFLIGLQARVRPYDAHLAAARYDVKSKIKHVKAPTLLLSGSEDSFCEYLEYTKSLMQNAIIKVLQGCGVFISIERPEQFAQAVLEFLDANT